MTQPQVKRARMKVNRLDASNESSIMEQTRPGRSWPGLVCLQGAIGMVRALSFFGARHF